MAKLKQADLDRRVYVTEKAALLAQVDTISLYLSSDRVVLAPRLTKQGVIEIETTVLAPDLIYDRGRLHDFVSRQIRTFVSVLKERLPVYAPALARSFDPATDIAFIVNASAARNPVARWEGGDWKWEKGGTIPVPVPDVILEAYDINEARTAVSGRKGCRCPARVNP